jgi:hypothetical protein
MKFARDGVRITDVTVMTAMTVEQGFSKAVPLRVAERRKRAALCPLMCVIAVICH